MGALDSGKFFVSFALFLNSDFLSVTLEAGRLLEFWIHRRWPFKGDFNLLILSPLSGGQEGGQVCPDG